MDYSSISYIAIPLAAIAGMIAGAAWYGVFAKQWMKAAGFGKDDIEQKASIYVVAVIAQFLLACMFTALFSHFGDVSIRDGILSAFFLWLGFCLAPMAVNHRFQDKGWDLTVIDGGYWLVVFVLQGAIISWLGG